MASSFPRSTTNLRWPASLHADWTQQLQNLTIAVCLTLGVAFTAASLGGVGDVLTRTLTPPGAEQD